MIVCKGEDNPDKLEIIKIQPGSTDFQYYINNEYILVGRYFEGDYNITACNKSFMISNDEQLIEFEDWLEVFKLDED